VVAGDKCSLSTGLTSADLPPRDFDPVRVEFATESISAHSLAGLGDGIDMPDRALCAALHWQALLSLYDQLHDGAGMRAASALSRASAAEARKPRGRPVAPNLKFVDLRGMDIASSK
jgi:hypothetical protein